MARDSTTSPESLSPSCPNCQNGKATFCPFGDTPTHAFDLRAARNAQCGFCLVLLEILSRFYLNPQPNKIAISESSGSLVVSAVSDRGSKDWYCHSFQLYRDLESEASTELMKRFLML
jgi:hypothetical protein